jgi:hypothetical protein
MRIIEPTNIALALLVSKGSIKADKDSPGKHRLRTYLLVGFAVTNTPKVKLAPGQAKSWE